MGVVLPGSESELAIELIQSGPIYDNLIHTVFLQLLHRRSYECQSKSTFPYFSGNSKWTDTADYLIREHFAPIDV